MKNNQMYTALALITIILISTVWTAKLEYKRGLLQNEVVIPKPTINDKRKYLDSTETIRRTYQTNGRSWIHAFRGGVFFGYGARWNTKKFKYSKKIKRFNSQYY